MFRVEVQRVSRSPRGAGRSVDGPWLPFRQQRDRRTPLRHGAKPLPIGRATGGDLLRGIRRPVQCSRLARIILGRRWLEFSADASSDAQGIANDLGWRQLGDLNAIRDWDFVRHRRRWVPAPPGVPPCPRNCPTGVPQYASE